MANWFLFCTEACQWFGNVRPLDIVDEFNNNKQTGSFDDYQERFDELKSYTLMINPLLNETPFIANYITGQKPETKTLAGLTNPTTLMDAYKKRAAHFFMLFVPVTISRPPFLFWVHCWALRVNVSCAVEIVLPIYELHFYWRFNEHHFVAENHTVDCDARDTAATFSHKCLELVKFIGFFGVFSDYTLALHLLRIASCLKKMILESKGDSSGLVEQKAISKCAKTLKAYLPPGAELLTLGPGFTKNLDGRSR